MRRDEIKYNHEQPLKKTGLSLLRSTLCYYYYYYYMFYRMCSRLYCFHYILYYTLTRVYVYNNVHTKINVYRYVLSEKTCNP